MRNLLLSAAVVCLPFVAPAATLSGDMIDVTIHGLGSQSVLVGSGTDFKLLGITLDFDAGSGNMNLAWTSNKLGTFHQYTSWTFSDLDFDDGSDLVGFLVTGTQFAGLSVSVTADSISFDFDQHATFNTGSVLSGTFITDAPSARQQLAPPAAIPLPATAPLLVLGAAGLVALRRRKSRV
jgi:hypothetical protein